jgi:hypothetical protein
MEVSDATLKRQQPNAMASTPSSLLLNTNKRLQPHASAARVALEQFPPLLPFLATENETNYLTRPRSNDIKIVDDELRVILELRIIGAKTTLIETLQQISRYNQFYKSTPKIYFNPFLKVIIS